MMKIAVLSIAVLGFVSASVLPKNVALDAEWSAFKVQYEKQYPTATVEAQRRAQWEENSAFIEQHNEQFAKGEVGFDLGMNHLGDLSADEVKQMLNGFRGDAPAPAIAHKIFDASSVGDVPDTVDWRTKNIVTGVKNQGQCGSCWAFSAVGSLEGQHALKTGNLTSLSEQNLVDCSDAQGNQGCNGGLMDSSFQYIQQSGGLDTEAAYPYTGRDGSCKFNKANIGASLLNYTDIPSGNETALTAAIATVGPISVAIDASSIFFQFYRSGVYHGLFCSTTRLDHGVTAVGYGTDSGKDYYLVKNSWGTFWGSSGYIMMSRNRGNNCGIATQASYPDV